MFVWSNIHENALNSAKVLIASATILQYYDPSSPVTLQVDALENTSDNGAQFDEYSRFAREYGFNLVNPLLTTAVVTEKRNPL